MLKGLGFGLFFHYDAPNSGSRAVFGSRHKLKENQGNLA
jgi:hypothetical protein